MKWTRVVSRCDRRSSFTLSLVGGAVSDGCECFRSGAEGIGRVAFAR